MFAEPVAPGSVHICDKHSLCRCHFAVYSPYTCISVKSIHFVHVGVTLQFIVHQIKITLPDTYIYHPNTWSHLINNIQVYMLINSWPQISNLLFQLMMLALKYQSIGTQFWHFPLRNYHLTQLIIIKSYVDI